MQRVDGTETGLSFSNKMVRTEVSWRHVVRYLESKNLLLVFTRDLHMHLIPKRAFNNDASMHEFFSLLQDHVPQGKFLDDSVVKKVEVEPL